MVKHISVINRIFFGIFLVGIVWASLHQRWHIVVVGVAGLAYAGWAIWASLRGQISDTSRLDIGQPTDERDRVLLSQALAIVGVAALALEAAIFLYRAGGPDTGQGVVESALRFVALCVVWLVANRVVVRRGTVGA